MHSCYLFYCDTTAAMLYHRYGDEQHLNRLSSVFARPENLFSLCSQGPLGCHAFYSKWIQSSHSIIMAYSPTSAEDLKLLVISLTTARLAQLLSLVGDSTLGRVLVVPNMVHMTIIKVTVLLGTLLPQFYHGRLQIIRDFVFVLTCNVIWNKCVTAKGLNTHNNNESSSRPSTGISMNVRRGISMSLWGRGYLPDVIMYVAQCKQSIG